MQRLKGIKIIRNSKGKPKQVLIDIDKHYDIVEDLIDVIEAESRMNEQGKPAKEVFKEIEAGFKKKKAK